MKPVFKKICCLMAGALLLSACETSSETAGKRPSTLEEYQTSSNKLLDSKVGNLFDMCIAYAAQGKQPSEAAFTSKGYTFKNIFGVKDYSLPIAYSEFDKLNGRNITMSFYRNGERCHLSLTGVGHGRHLTAGWAHKRLAKAGYNRVESNNRWQSRYRKGELEIVMGAGDQHGRTVVSLLKGK